MAAMVNNATQKEKSKYYYSKSKLFDGLGLAQKLILIYVIRYSLLRGLLPRGSMPGVA